MTKLISFGRDLLRDDEGLAMVEYTILLALIAVATIVLISQVGTKVTNAWTTLDNNLAANGVGTGTGTGGGGTTTP